MTVFIARMMFFQNFALVMSIDKTIDFIPNTWCSTSGNVLFDLFLATGKNSQKLKFGGQRKLCFYGGERASRNFN